MKNLLKHLLLLLVAAAGVASCSGNDEQAVSDTSGAYERGQSDAKALSSANYTADKDLHAALLAVKSREWQLREKGDNVGADAYIDGFRHYLSEHDQTLANKIF